MLAGAGRQGSIERDPAQIKIPGDVTVQKEGTNFISFQFEEGVSVDLTSGLCTLHFKNPNASNHYVVVHLQLTDEVAKASMGGTGLSEKEQAEIEAQVYMVYTQQSLLNT